MDVGRLRRHLRPHDGTGREVVAIDASIVVMKRGTDRAGVSCLVNLVEVLVDAGYAVVVVCDGAMRHHSKRAAIARRTKRSNNMLRRRTLFSECTLLAQQVRDLPANEREMKLKEFEEKRKELQTIEKSAECRDRGRRLWEMVENAVTTLVSKRSDMRDFFFGACQYPSGCRFGTARCL